MIEQVRAGRGRRVRRALGLALWIPFHAGCVSTVPLSPEPVAGDPGLRFLNQDGGRVGRVVTADSAFIAGRLRVDPLRRELSMWVVPGDSLAVPLARVQEIQITNPARGTLEGIGAGLLVAAAVGLTAGLISDGTGERSRGEQGLHVGGITAVFTVPIGFVFGVSAGHLTVVEVGAGR